MAVVDLDKPPGWWHEQASDHMTAKEARAFAGTDGRKKYLSPPCMIIQHASCLNILLL